MTSSYGAIMPFNSEIGIPNPGHVHRLIVRLSVIECQGLGQRASDIAICW